MNKKVYLFLLVSTLLPNQDITATTTADIAKKELLKSFTNQRSGALFYIFYLKTMQYVDAVSEALTERV